MSGGKIIGLGIGTLILLVIAFGLTLLPGILYLFTDIDPGIIFFFFKGGK